MHIRAFQDEEIADLDTRGHQGVAGGFDIEHSSYRLPRLGSDDLLSTVNVVCCARKRGVGHDV